MTPYWEAMKNEYICGFDSYSNLAEKYGAERSAVARRGRSEGWPALRAEYHGRGEAADAAERASMARLDEVTDMLLDRVVQLLRGDSVDAQTIQRLASSVKSIRDTKGLRTDPDAREQEAKIRSLEQKTQAEAAADSERSITVSLGDAAEYSL